MVNSPEHTMLQVLAFKVATLIDEDEEIVEFNKLIDNFVRDGNVQQLVHGLKVLIRKPARLQLFDDVRRVVPLRMQMEYNLLVPYTSNRTRNVRLLRRGPPATVGFGFSIRGGREHGTGFFVSAVEINSEAHHQGLRVGDQIVRINGFSVEDAIHQEVLHLIQSYNHVNLRVRSVGMIPVKDSDFTLQDDFPSPPLLSRNVSEPILRFMLPGKQGSRTSLPASESSSRRSSLEGADGEKTPQRRVPPSIGKIGRSASSASILSTKKHDPLTWRMVDGKSVSSGPRPLLRTASEASMIEGPSTYDEERDIKLFLDTTNHPSLGVSICKGSQQRPGIYVQSVREAGLAWEAGLATGDQILECNGVNFENIAFDEAVRVLKSSKQLDLLVRKGAGVEMFGESSGYNSSSSSLNGDSPIDKNSKRLSLITEDPGEDGERSRSNSRRGPDDAVTIVTQHMSTIIATDTVDSTQVQVSAQVHRGQEEGHDLARSSSGSSVSSLSSAISLEAKRRSERRENEDQRRKEIALKAVPEERRHKHAMLMEEFQQVHRKMFTESDQQERFHHESRNGDIYAVVQNGHSVQHKGRPAPLSISDAEAATAALAKDAPTPRRGTEMNSIDNLTLNSPLSPKPKPPAVYFGAGRASSKSQPGVVTISEYPNSDRRSAPNRLEFLGTTSPVPEVDDPQSALASELQNTLSRSNLRQLSEPSATPPPPSYPAPSPPPPAIISPPPTVNGVQYFEPVYSGSDMPEMRKNHPKPINYRRPMSQSPPPVIALKPLAVPYTELVNQSNYSTNVVLPVEPIISLPPPIIPSNTVPVSKPVSTSSLQPPAKSNHQSNNILDTLANKVTIKFPNGESASAGTKSLNALLATAPPATERL